MPNTYTQLHVHFVFAVKYRAAIIQPEWNERLHKYITGIVQNNGYKMLAVNAVTDHIHFFCRDQSESIHCGFNEIGKGRQLRIHKTSRALLRENSSGKAAMALSVTVIHK